LPLRASLFALAPDRHVLLLLLHHIAGDGWSIGVLARDFAQAYAARCAGEPPAWLPLSVQYADYALWHRALLGSDDDADSAIGRQIAHWRHTLDGAPDEIALPFDRRRPGAPTYRGAGVPIWIDAPLHGRIAALARAEGVSLFVVLHAAVAAL